MSPLSVLLLAGCLLAVSWSPTEAAGRLAGPGPRGAPLRSSRWGEEWSAAERPQSWLHPRLPAPSAVWERRRRLSQLLLRLPAAGGVQLEVTGQPAAGGRSLRTGQLAGARGESARLGAAARMAEQRPGAKRQAQVDSRETAIHFCGSLLTDTLALVCHGRQFRSSIRRRDVSATDAAHSGLHTPGRPLHRARRGIVEECCYSPCTLSTIVGYCHDECAQRDFFFSPRPQHHDGQHYRSPEESNVPVTTMGTPPIHTPVVQDRGYVEDGFEKRSTWRNAVRWLAGHTVQSSVFA